MVKRLYLSSWLGGEWKSAKSVRPGEALGHHQPGLGAFADPAFDIRFRSRSLLSGAPGQALFDVQSGDVGQAALVVALQGRGVVAKKNRVSRMGLCFMGLFYPRTLENPTEQVI